MQKEWFCKNLCCFIIIFYAISGADSANLKKIRKTTDPEEIKRLQYSQKVIAHMHKYWHHPKIVGWHKQLKSVICLTIHKSGLLFKAEIRETSGDISFDQYALRIIKKADPYPTFPKEMEKETQTYCIVMTPEKE